MLWRFALLNVGLAWIAIGILAFALYAVLEPVNKRLFLLFLRSRSVPRALAGFGTVASVLFFAASAAMFVFPQRINELKLLGVPTFLVEVVTARWLLFNGLQPRATAAARA